MEASKESFRACVKKLIADRGLSIPKLTVMLGYPSETTLRRVNQNKAGIKSLRKVYADLIACEQLQLSDNEAGCSAQRYCGRKRETVTQAFTMSSGICCSPGPPQRREAL